MDKLLNHVMEFIYQNDEADGMDAEQAEIIRYGLEVVLLKVIFIVATLIVGILMKSFLGCLTFMVMFMPLRSYAGGYHAKTRMQCFIQSVLTIAIIIGLLKIINTYILTPLLILSLISLPFIWILAPVDTENKRLDKEECAIFKRKTRIVLILEVIVAIATYILGQNILIELKVITYTVMLAICDVALLVIVEHIKNKKAGGLKG